MKATIKQTGMAKGLIPVFALITSAACFAGDTYVEPAPMPAPAPAPSLWNWFVGGSAIYVDGWEDEMWTFHVGAEKFVGQTSHALFLEIGWAGDDDKWNNKPYRPTTTWEWDVDLIPVSLNYKFERPLFGSSLHYYLGGGVGVLFADADMKRSLDGRTVEKDSWSDEVLFGQLVGGLAWNLTDNFEILGGVRWMYFENMDLDNGNDEVAAEVGLRFNF